MYHPPKPDPRVAARKKLYDSICKFLVFFGIFCIFAIVAYNRGIDAFRVHKVDSSDGRHLFMTGGKTESLFILLVFTGLGSCITSWEVFKAAKAYKTCCRDEENKPSQVLPHDHMNH